MKELRYRYLPSKFNITASLFIFLKDKYFKLGST